MGFPGYWKDAKSNCSTDLYQCEVSNEHDVLDDYERGILRASSKASE